MQTQPFSFRAFALALLLAALPLAAAAQSSSPPPNAVFFSGINKLDSTGTYFSSGQYSPITSYNQIMLEGQGTILNFATGASAFALGMTGFNDSVHVTGGTIDYFGTGAFDTATLDGGTFINAGAGDYSTLNVDYGQYNTVLGRESSIVNVRGGNISYLTAVDNSTFNVFGQNLAIISTPSGDYLTGILENGATLRAQINPYGDYNLIPVVANVPEASSMVSFGLLLLLGAGGIIWRSKRRRGV